MTPRTVVLSYALGTGHRQVAGILSQELSHLGHACEHRPLEQWVPLDYDLLFRHGYLLLALRAPSVWDGMYNSGAFKKRKRLALPIMDRRVVRRFGQRIPEGVDLIVATQYNAMEVAADWKQKTGSTIKLAAIITDYDVYPLWARNEVDLFILPHEDLKPMLLEKGIPEERLTATGIPVAPTFERSHDPSSARAALGLEDASPIVLLLGGGVGAGPLGKAALSALEVERCKVVVVCGLNKKLRRSLVPLAHANPSRLRVLGYRNDIPSLMAASSLIVTKGGGLSLSEALYMGRRVIVIPSLPGQERANIEYMDSHQWAGICGNVEDLPGMISRSLASPLPIVALPPNPARNAAERLDALVRE